MASEKHRPEQALAKLRQADVLVSQGRSVAEAIRAIGVTEVTYHRWRREFGGLKSGQAKRPKALEAENARRRKAAADLTLVQADPGGGRPGELLGPARRRARIEHVRRVLPVSERRACAALGRHRSTRREAPRGREDEERLTADIVELARQYGRYGYREVTAPLRDAGWLVNAKRVERIWRREGLKVPPRRPKRGRLRPATAPASGSGRSGRTTSGATTSSRTAPTTGAGSGR